MNIQDQIPEGYAFTNILSHQSSDEAVWFSCVLFNEKDMRYDAHAKGNSPDEALAEACNKAREYNLWNLLEEK